MTSMPLTSLGMTHALTRCDNFVEQREHRSMAYRVIGVNERGGTIAWT
jgi:hypothetical protein